MSTVFLATFELLHNSDTWCENLKVPDEACGLKKENCHMETLTFSNPLSPIEIKKFKPYDIVGPEYRDDALTRARARVEETGVFTRNQVMRRKYPIGCVALEVTQQRCNLDCTLCYLSENSGSVKDIPLEEVFRRMYQIKNHHGPGTDVQITGGDPTLRDRKELVQIVKRVRSLGMKPTLMTNGLKATRDLLLVLVDAGLNDVALHVGTTQERRGYTNEVSLNELRLKYIERAKGLPINVIFNTTVYKGNFRQTRDAGSYGSAILLFQLKV